MRAATNFRMFECSSVGLNPLLHPSSPTSPFHLRELAPGMPPAGRIRLSDLVLMVTLCMSFRDLG